MTVRVPSLVLHRLEAQAIHQALFRRDAPRLVLERFLSASPSVNARFDEPEVARYYEIIERPTDLESVEVAARYAGVLPLLSLKFRLMVYLAETLPENQPLFVQLEPSPIGAWWALGAGAFETAWKLVKGRYLLRRFGVA